MQRYSDKGRVMPIRIGLVPEGPVSIRSGNFFQGEGEGIYVHALARAFAGVTVFAHVLRPGDPAFEDTLGYPMASPNLTVVELPLAGTDRYATLRKFGQLWRTLRTLWAYRDTVDLHYIFLPGYSGVLATLMCRLMRRPYALYLAADWPEAAEFLIPFEGGLARALLPLYRRAVGLLQDTAVRGARFVMVAGAWLHAKYAGSGAPVFETIPRINWAAYPDAGRTDTCGGATITLLFVGFLLERKGAEYFVDAISLLRRRGLNVRGVIVGSGDREPHLRRQIARLGLTSFIAMRGLIMKGEDIAREYRAADIMVFASLGGDGFPRVLYEAMSQGLPIISTDVCGISLKLGAEKEALFVRPGDARGIADAVERLGRDSGLRRTLIHNGRAFMRPLAANVDSGVQICELVERYAGLGVSSGSAIPDRAAKSGALHEEM